MATATVTALPNGGYRVPLNKALSDRVKFLQVLVAKIKNAAVKAVKKAVTFARRAWDVVAAHTTKGGVGLAMITATKTGYTALTGVFRKVLSFVSSNFGKVVRAIHNAVDKIGYTIASYVGIVNKRAGNFLQSVNMKFTDLRWKAIDYVSKSTSVFSIMAQQAFNSELTVRATTLGSTAIATGMLMPSIGSFLSGLPIIGSFFAFAMTGGLFTLAAIAGIATMGAVLTVGNTKLMPIVKAKLAPVTRAIKNKSIITRLNEDGTVIVENAASAEEAEQLANAHAEQDVKLLEGLLRGGSKRR